MAKAYCYGPGGGKGTSMYAAVGFKGSIQIKVWKPNGGVDHFGAFLFD